MNKLWTPEERLEAINKVAYYGNKWQTLDLYWVIGALTNATPEFLNSDTDIIDYLKICQT
jgi:hypothetical protein